jgi:hypothetical protein
MINIPRRWSFSSPLMSYANTPIARMDQTMQWKVKPIKSRATSVRSLRRRMKALTKGKTKTPPTPTARKPSPVPNTRQK